MLSTIPTSAENINGKKGLALGLASRNSRDNPLFAQPFFIFDVARFEPRAFLSCLSEEMPGGALCVLAP